MKDEVTFSLKCTMKSRWVPHFLSMLKYMQTLGGLGSSRVVSFMSDGDGDFRPRFEFDKELSSDAEPVKDVAGNRHYDAG